MKLKGEYLKWINKLDKRQEDLRARNEKELRPIVERKALSVGLNMINTQHSLSSDLDYREQLEHVKFQQFQDFIIYVADNHRIDFYFEVEDGKITFF